MVPTKAIADKSATRWPANGRLVASQADATPTMLTVVAGEIDEATVARVQRGAPGLSGFCASATTRTTSSGGEWVCRYLLIEFQSRVDRYQVDKVRSVLCTVAFRPLDLP